MAKNVELYTDFEESGATGLGFGGEGVYIHIEIVIGVYIYMLKAGPLHASTHKGSADSMARKSIPEVHRGLMEHLFIV